MSPDQAKQMMKIIHLAGEVVISASYKATVPWHLITLLEAALIEAGWDLKSARALKKKIKDKRRRARAKA